MARIRQADATLRSQLYVEIECERLADLELDAAPKDDRHPFAGASPREAKRLQREYCSGRGAQINQERVARSETPRVRTQPSTPHEFEVEQRRARLVEDAYRCKVAGDEFEARGNADQADEFYEQETRLLEEAEAL